MPKKPSASSILRKRATVWNKKQKALFAADKDRVILTQKRRIGDILQQMTRHKLAHDGYIQRSNRPKKAPKARRDGYVFKARPGATKIGRAAKAAAFRAMKMEEMLEDGAMMDV